jgi:hypothetical protein
MYRCRGGQSNDVCLALSPCTQLSDLSPWHSAEVQLPERITRASGQIKKPERKGDGWLR